LSALPDLGVTATVFMDRESHAPRTIPSEMGELRELEGDAADGFLVEDIRIVSHWAFHVALFALQNPTPQTIERALELIGVSGDVDEWVDHDSLRAEAVLEPPGWRGHS
jgi:hypothetical protein